jgi:ribosome-binding protein aMBF1 (putative translation factor)
MEKEKPMPSAFRKKPPIIETPRGERLAVIPEAEYRHLREAAENLADVRAFDRAKRRLARGEDELIPFEMAERLSKGENSVRVWREHRGLKVSELAARAGIKPAYLSQIESGAREGKVATLSALAKALGVTLDDLVA